MESGWGESCGKRLTAQVVYKILLPWRKTVGEGKGTRPELAFQVCGDGILTDELKGLEEFAKGLVQRSSLVTGLGMALHLGDDA